MDQALSVGFLAKLFDVMDSTDDMENWGFMKWEIQERAIMCLYTLLIANDDPGMQPLSSSDRSGMHENRVKACEFVISMLKTSFLPIRIQKPYAAFICEMVKYGTQSEWRASSDNYR